MASGWLYMYQTKSNTMEHASIINKYSFIGDMASQSGVNETISANLQTKPGKKSFLVFRRNKYVIVPTENIALFYVKCESAIIMTFDRQEYVVNYSLEQLQQLLSAQHYFRLNRQHLINFYTIKEVEHYFARKLLVIPTVPFTEKLIVSKEKGRTFLTWLENR
jgi:DNA-binding LytR/AlgR family response regulator